MNFGYVTENGVNSNVYVTEFVQQLKKSLSIGPQKIKIDIKAAITTVVDVKEEKLLWT